MGMLDDLLGQAGSRIDIAALAGKVGIDAGTAQAALNQLLPQIADPAVDNGTAVQAVAQGAGIDAGALGALLPQLLGAVQGAGGSGGMVGQLLAGLSAGGSQSGGLLGQVAGMLDRDGDGNPVNDVMGMIGRK